MIMIDYGIARAIANIAIFLEFSSEDLLNEDASLQAMEQLAADLQQLDNGSRQGLLAGLDAIASSYQGEAHEFVKNLADALGIR
jgi:hypothetical protein